MIQILETRYDHQSARVVLKNAADSAGLDAKGPFDGGAVGKLAAAIQQAGDRVDDVVKSLREAGSTKPAAEKKPAGKPAQPAKKPAGKAPAGKPQQQGKGKK